jgi:hypothetical protein
MIYPGNQDSARFARSIKESMTYGSSGEVHCRCCLNISMPNAVIDGVRTVVDGYVRGNESDGLGHLRTS